MPPPPVRQLALALAVLGQLAGASGLPVISADPDRTGYSPCGCSPADRAAGRCCCARSNGACCSAQPDPDDDLPPCCKARKAKERVAQIQLVISVLRQKCLGDHEQGPTPTPGPAVPPNPPAAWAAEAPDAGSAPTPAPIPFRIARPPADPPPRPVAAI